MHSLLFDSLLLSVTVLAFLGRKEAQAFIKDFTTVGEDLWTWSTCSGDIYEEVELQQVGEREVVIRHRYGTSRVAIQALSAQTHELLSRTALWREFISAGPAEGKISTFPAAHAEAA